MSMGVPQHVVDCFLGDAEAGGLGVRLELVRRLRRIEMWRDSADAGLPIEVRAQRRRQAEIIELRRTEAQRQLPYALERVLNRLDAFGDARAPRRGARA